MKKIAPAVLVLGLLIGAFFAVSCGGGGSKAAKTANLRVVNADSFNSGTAGYDFLVGGASFASGLQFHNTSAYGTLAAGSQTIEVRNAGTSTDLVSTTQNLTGGNSYSFVTIGAAATVSAVFLTDNNAAATSGNFQLRVVNASSVLSPVDVYVVPSTGNCGSYLFGVSADMSGVAFAGSSSYKTFTAGDYQFCVTTAGGKTPYFYGGTTTYASGAVQTIIIEDSGGSLPLQIQTLTDATS